MNVTEALTSAAKGAAAGAIAGPVGAAVGGIGGLVLDIAPAIGRSLFGSAGEKTAGQVARAIETVTGTSDAEAAQAVLARDPEAVSQLRVQLLTLGSSSGSAVKSDQMAALSVSAQQLVPGDVVHRLLQQKGGKVPA
jgi:hypothetical protein